MAERRDSGDGKDATQRPPVLETSPPILPQFDELDADGQQMFGLSNALLNYNMQQMQANNETVLTVQTATAELVHPPESLLTASPLTVLSNAGTFGHQLRQISDDFRNSRFANEANQLADGIRLDSVTYEGFVAELRNLFEKGHSIEAFVALFHFLARLLMRCYAENGRAAFTEMCRSLLRWFLFYLLEELVRFAADFIQSLNAAERNHFMLGCAVGAGASAVFALLGYYVYRKYLS